MAKGGGVPRQMFADILSLIARLRAPPLRAGIKCGKRRQRRCASMQLEQPRSVLQRGQTAALNAICARRTLLPIAQVVHKAIMVSNPPEWQMSANLRRPIIASERVDRTGVGVAPDR